MLPCFQGSNVLQCVRFDIRAAPLKSTCAAFPLMRLIVIALLAAALAAAAAPTPDTVASTSCWDCHAEGRWDPPLQEPVLASYRLQQDDGWELVAVLENPWRHHVKQVFTIVAGLEAAGLPPVGGEVVTMARSGSLPAAMADPRPAEFLLDLPNGTQAVRATLHASDLHDLRLVVRPGGQAATAAAAYGPHDIAAVGWTGWGFEVHRQDALPTDAAFRLVVEADASVHPDGVLAAAPPAPPLGSTEIRWPVEAASGSGMLDFEVVFVMSYVHDLQANPDEEQARIQASVRHLDGSVEAAEALQEEAPGFAAAAFVVMAAVAWTRRR